MSPPELSGDTPITNICEPIVPRLFKARWNNFNVPVFHRFKRLGTHAFRFDKPLTTDKRFNDLPTSL
jgi:hypothetical protein